MYIISHCVHSRAHICTPYSAIDAVMHVLCYRHLHNLCYTHMCYATDTSVVHPTLVAAEVVVVVVVVVVVGGGGGGGGGGGDSFVLVMEELPLSVWASARQPKDHLALSILNISYHILPQFYHLSLHF